MAILTVLDKTDFEKILSKYNLGTYRSHKHEPLALDNTVYYVNTTKGKFVLKIFETSDSKFVKLQILIMNYLSKKNVPVAVLVPTKRKTYLVKHKKKNLTLQKFLEGDSKFKLNDILIKHLAKTIGMLHKNLMKLNLRRYSHHWYEKDHQFRQSKWIVKSIGKFPIQKHHKVVLGSLQSLNRRKLRKGMVHADLHPGNFLIKKNKVIAILDWDDTHIDYLVFDFATAVTQFFIKQSTSTSQLRLFLRTYQKIIGLNSEEKKALYYLIKNKLLNDINYFYLSKKKHKDIASKLEKWTKKGISSFNRFDKTSLDEFVSYFEE